MKRFHLALFFIALLSAHSFAQNGQSEWAFPTQGMKGEYSTDFDAILYDIGNGFHAAHVVSEGQKVVILTLPSNYEETIAELARKLGLSSYDKMFVGGALTKIIKTPDNPDDFYINTVIEKGVNFQHYRTKSGAEVVAIIGPDRTSIIAWLVAPKTTSQRAMPLPKSQRRGTIPRRGNRASRGSVARPPSREPIREEDPAIIERRSKLKIIKEIETDQINFIEVPFVINGVIELSSYYNYGYGQAQASHYAFQLTDNTGGASVYMLRGEAANALRQQLLAAGGKLRGSFTIIIRMERFDRTSSSIFAELIDFGPPIN